MNQSVGYETLSIRLIGVRFSQFLLTNRSVTAILAVLPNRAHGDPNAPLNSPIHVVSYHRKAGEHRLRASYPSTCRYAAYALIQRH